MSRPLAQFKLSPPGWPLLPPASTTIVQSLTQFLLPLLWTLDYPRQYDLANVRMRSIQVFSKHIIHFGFSEA